MKKDRNLSFSFVMFPFNKEQCIQQKKENLSGEKHLQVNVYNYTGRQITL